jgi:hypothetical protein
MHRATMASLWMLQGAVLGIALLSACPTVDLGDQPPDPEPCRPDMQYFHDHIWPEYLAPADPAKSCVANAGCHQAASGRSALRLQTDPVDDAQNYQVVTTFLNCSTPEASFLLTKPLKGGEPHGGGDIFQASTDPAVQTFLMWFP